MTVGELRRAIDRQPTRYDQTPVVLLVQGMGEYLTGYATGVTVANDNLPDGMGGTVGATGVVLLIEGDLEG